VKNTGPPTPLDDLTKSKGPKIVLVAGFESFNRDLYYKAAEDLEIDLTVFADSDIRIPRPAAEGGEGDCNPWRINPIFEEAVRSADAFIGSLIFDYDDSVAVQQLLLGVTGPRLIFESATELMEYNQVGSFSMMKAEDDASGPPPAVKAILSKFGSGKEEDKLAGYLSLLKVGPDLLKYVPGEKAGDLRAWLETYRYWNQGGKKNVQAMLQLIAGRCNHLPVKQIDLPELVVTPDIGIVHPLRYNTFTGRDLVDESSSRGQTDRFFDSSPDTYLKWRLSPTTKALAERQKFKLAPDNAPKVALLLFRKHVITEQKYIPDLIEMMEAEGIIPIPIFINGVEAHTIVRDLLTSEHEIREVSRGNLKRDSTYQPSRAVSIDAIVNSIGFPLVGGPAGSMEAGRNVAVAEQLLSAISVPYIVASPLLLQSIPQWKKNGVLGLQSVVLYSLPELDGAIDTVVLGGLVGDKIALIPERVRKLTSRVKGWVNLRRTPAKDRKVAISLYGFPPNVGAVGTAALLDVPHSLEGLLLRLEEEGYDTGNWSSDPDASGESLVAALSIMCENAVIMAGAERMQAAVDTKINRAQSNDETVAATLARPGGGLGGAKVRAKNVSSDELEKMLGKYMMKKVRRAWSEKDPGPGVSANGEYVVSGLEIGNVLVFVQPLLGVEGDPMRLLFERDLTPHPQYVAAYEWLRLPETNGGIGAQTIVHLGMHGTVEWLPGQPLGNDRNSWSDELIGDLPNIYVYAANNPSESILAKRRGYATIVSYNVPPYGRSGLYLELATLKEMLDEYRTMSKDGADKELCQTIYDCCQRTGMVNDCPLLADPKDQESVVTDSELPDSIYDNNAFAIWMLKLSDYLNILQDRLFSSGLRSVSFVAPAFDASGNSFFYLYCVMHVLTSSFVHSR
jgi:magnesium chelatase subunit H